jgi:two-component system CheB/CheR fusion protein
VRADEAVGAHLMNLDIGLPLDDLRQPLRDQLSGPGASEPSALTLAAVNRRGRAINVRVTLTHLVDSRTTTTAAMMVMDELDAGGT